LKTRIITGVVGGALLLGVLFLPPIVLYSVFSLLCGLAVWEMFSALGLTKYKVITALSIVYAVIVPISGWAFSRPMFFAALGGYLLSLVAVQLWKHDSIPVQDTALGFFFATFLSFGIACVAFCRGVGEQGVFYFLLTLIIAWGADTGAYFVGVFFGKHKLCPVISPKKTVEGFIGGWIFSVLAAVLLALLWQKYFLPAGVLPSYWQIALTAFVLAPFSVIGDLFASVVKRQVGAKDYGNIMPGHGGVMDRFDSLLFVAPLLYAVLQFTTLLQVG
jgi:phosphatidate cytidylyltransferase